MIVVLRAVVLFASFLSDYIVSFNFCSDLLGWQQCHAYLREKLQVWSLRCVSVMNSQRLPLHAGSLSIRVILECINCLNSTLPNTISQSLPCEQLSHLYCIKLLWLTLCVCVRTHTHIHTRVHVHGCFFFATLDTCVCASKECLLQSEISSRSYRGYVRNLCSTNT